MPGPVLDEKVRRGYDAQIGGQPSAAVRSRRSGLLISRAVPAIILIVGSWLVFRSVFVLHHHYCPGKDLAAIPRPAESHALARVPLEAHIMSKCPDAKACLKELVVPAMAKISDKVDFTLSYIGTVDPNSDDVACMHGPSECLGNIIELCAAKEYPDPKLYLGFTNCLTTDYARIPDRDLVSWCALEHGIDFEKINDCISGEDEGISLLRSSVERSRDNNVTKSCTVRLNSEIRCIHDGGKWYDCPGGSSVEDLVRDVEDLYSSLDDWVVVIGESLVDTIDDLIHDGRIEPQLALRVLANFDRVVSETLAENVKSRLTFKGHLETYRFCDDVWTFLVKDVKFKSDADKEFHADKVKIVSCNSKKPGET
ncbi:hypothetical protein DV738_g5165, partial [Chaetothyriales sp. CBS 135597]